MKPQKFIEHFKCDCFQPENYCSCPNKIIASDTLIESVNDIAGAVVEVMNLCGINLVKAKAARDVIIHYLLHFEEIRHRIDSIPKKRLAKEGLINDLSRKYNMNRMETQMTYTIIKRVFKAFYYGTDEGGVTNPLISRKLIHTPECLWVHAAERTAQIYAAYAGIFYASQKDFECKIKLVYKQLYDRIASRAITDEGGECVCMKCLKRINAETLRRVTVTTKMHGRDGPYEAMYLQEEATTMETENEEQTDVKESSSEIKCTCPPLKLSESDYAYRTFAESVTSDSSQGPFNCHWFSISKEEYEADDDAPHINLPEEVPCSPCHYLDSECEPECRCSCEECKCEIDPNYFCSDLDVSFETDFSQMEMDDEGYDEDIEDTSSKTTNEVQDTATRTIIASAKCSARDPARFVSKCSTENKNVTKRKSIEETHLGSPEHQQLYNTDIATNNISLN